MNAYEKYNFAVRYKVDLLKNHERYDEFKEYTEKQLYLRCGSGLIPIQASGYTDIILLRSKDEIEKWLNNESDLGFRDEEKGYMRDKVVNTAYEKIYNEHFKSR